MLTIFAISVFLPLAARFGFRIRLSFEEMGIAWFVCLSALSPIAFLIILFDWPIP